MDPLAKLREELDGIDDELLSLLNRRARTVERVATLKAKSDAPFYAPDREREIIERLSQNNAGPFPSSAIAPVMQEVISACLSLEQRQRVAYLGPEGTFTHMAVLQQFGRSARPVPCGTIAAVFEAVERDQANFGVVPIENSSEGMVAHTLDTFVDTDLHIIAEVHVLVAHCLLVKHGGSERTIERVYSHPQALAQCSGWLKANLPGAALIESASTADAARACHADPRAAAIASEQAGRIHDLELLRSHIQDHADNVTRFLVLAKEPRVGSPMEADTTTVLMVLRHDPGALYAALKPLSTAGINLTKIESRPSRREAWDYVFFLDLDGNAASDPLAAALGEVRRHCLHLKVLGTYRKRT